MVSGAGGHFVLPVALVHNTHRTKPWENLHWLQNRDLLIDIIYKLFPGSTIKVCIYLDLMAIKGLLDHY